MLLFRSPLGCAAARFYSLRARRVGLWHLLLRQLGLEHMLTLFLVVQQKR